MKNWSWSDKTNQTNYFICPRNFKYTNTYLCTFTKLKKYWKSLISYNKVGLFFTNHIFSVKHSIECMCLLYTRLNIHIIHVYKYTCIFTFVVRFYLLSALENDIDYVCKVMRNIIFWSKRCMKQRTHTKSFISKKKN